MANKPVQTVIVERMPVSRTGANVTRFEVVRVEGTTSPLPDDILTKDEVDQLIASGVLVKIDKRRGRG